MQAWLKKANATERSQVAAKAGTSVGYLYQIAGGHRRPSLELSRKLRNATDGEVSISSLRPDLYEILIGTEQSAA
jgi:transcriptional regulator with XRE-family HTH domain